MNRKSTATRKVATTAKLAATLNRRSANAQLQAMIEGYRPARNAK